MLIFFSLFFRLDPPILNLEKDGFFMDTYTLLDQDYVKIYGKNKDVFIAIQPHNIMGSIYSTVSPTSHDGKNSNRDKKFNGTVKHYVGDRFYVSNSDIFLNYTYRGGSVVNVFSLPRGLCDPEYSIFTTMQREAHISIDETFQEDRKICWFLNFKTPVEFEAIFHDGPKDSKLMIGDQKHLLTNHWYDIPPTKSILNGGLNRSNLIVLDAKKGHISLNISVTSGVPFADWTDRPSFFAKRNELLSYKKAIEGINIKCGDITSNEPFNKDLKMYITTVRNVKIWIWAILCGIIASIFGFTVVIFFVKPIRKIHRSLSHSDDLAKASRKTKTE
ncbi:hypothetical protein TRFO_38974 [Tritrichomonas foetus]|uniref:Uncharacterized protein n=1 Tax=Tritrichomonas foetus TaxID=1144522 RepID=A0A1J4J9A5_9EUKA|nr:hypothetical protein TRFO_38974 [Tritrichomonas foetus]|eukprot:OHS94831.1 hypothetical protein TRFO_38974 [Tritrichomonas foetus]